MGHSVVDDVVVLQTAIPQWYLQLTFIGESWKTIENAGPSPSAFSGKKSRAPASHQFVYVYVLWMFFSESTLGEGPKNDIYFRSKWHISSHIGICHFKLALSDSSTDILSVYIILFSQSQR